MNYRPQPGVDSRTSNAEMAARILQMPIQPYKEGGFVYRVAEMKGRKSGQMIQVPIAVTMSGGQLYLISPTIERNWVHNLLADAHCALVTKEAHEIYRAELVTGLEAVSVLRVYLSQLQWASQNFPFATDAPDNVILENLNKVGVFCLRPDSQ